MKNKVFKIFVIMILSVNISYAGSNPKIDKATFQEIDAVYAKDKNGVYFLNGEKFVKINGADIDSFEVTMSGKYGKDRNNVYFEGKKMEGENPKKFEEIDIND